MGRKRIRKLALDPSSAEEGAKILKVLGNQARLQITAYLCANNEKRVGEICKNLGMAQSTVSQHLSLLRLHGLLRARREGGYRFYSVAQPGVKELLNSLASCESFRAVS